MTPIIIVGAGAAGAAAALQLARQGLRPVLLDVGEMPQPGPRATGNLYEWRRHYDSFDLHIGADYAGVSDILTGHAGIAKLNAPNSRYVIRGAETLSPVAAHDFDPIQSFAFGGLGNAWGAGLYRFVDADLRGYPLTAADLDPYQDILTQEIGISGAADDLTPYFGSPAGLQPPLRLSRNAARVARGYAGRRAALQAKGIVLGRPRVGALTLPLAGRAPVDYSNTEFWQEQPYLYTPSRTLRKLSAAGQLDYRRGCLVESYREAADGVTVRLRNLATGAFEELSGDRLLLAAGALGTSKIVLNSAGDTTTRLRLLENPAVQIPFVLPAAIGAALDTHCFGLTQLNLIWQSAAYDCTAQGSLLELTSPMRAEFFGRFPLSARANLTLIRQLLPAMLVMQLFFPAAIQPAAALRLQGNGHLRIDGSPNAIDVRKLGGLLGPLRGLGLWTHASLITKPETGHAIHYAGTLPMRDQPAAYECHPTGRLGGAERVYIADSACFTDLPAKNMSFGMMANAMRVAEAATKGTP